MDALLQGASAGKRAVTALMIVFILLLCACGNQRIDNSMAAAQDPLEEYQRVDALWRITYDTSLAPAPAEIAPASSASDAVETIEKMGVKMDLTASPITVRFGLYSILTHYVNEPVFIFTASGVECPPRSAGVPEGSDRALNPVPAVRCDEHIVVSSEGLGVLNFLTVGVES